MSNMRFEKTGKKKHKQSKGFYVALGVCLVAVGAAAWTTYDSVKDYMAPTASSPVSSGTVVSSKDDKQAGATMSGVKQEPSSAVSSKTESEVSSADSSSKAESSSKASSSSKTTSSKTTQTNTGNSMVVYPVGKNVTKPYSKGEPVKSLTFGDWRVHNGTDFSAKKGDSVKAMTDGIVKEIRTDVLLGKVVVIDHGAFTASYCGLGDTVLVKKDAQVKVGDQIGSIKEVPSEIVEESHLHLEVVKDGKNIDPMSVLDVK